MSLVNQPLVIAGREFQSRLMVGTGKFSSPVAMRDALDRMYARQARLREDIENDRLLLGGFVAVACRVQEMDRVRVRALDRGRDDRGLGRTLFAKGEPLDEGLYLALLHALSLAELSEGSIGEDVILTSDRRIYLTRIVPSRPSIALFAVLERDESNLGMARVLMKNAASSIPTLEA